MEEVDFLKQHAFQTINVKMEDLIGLPVMNYQTIYNYKGSMTTPGCEQQINWYVVETPFMISVEQLEFFDTTYLKNSSYPLTGNARELQPVYDRKVIKMCNVHTQVESAVLPGRAGTHPALVLGFGVLALYVLLFISKWYLFKEYYKGHNTSIMTMHPMISIFMIPPEQHFAKQARYTLFVTTILTQFAINAVLFDEHIVKYMLSSIFKHAWYSIFLAVPINYILGGLAYLIYNSSGSANDATTCSPKALKRIFFGLAWVFIALDLMIIMQETNDLTEEYNILLIAGSLFGLVMDTFVVEFVIIMLVSYFGFLVCLCKFRGYYFELKTNKIQDKYVELGDVGLSL
jgi:hypothetical protein